MKTKISKFDLALTVVVINLFWSVVFSSTILNFWFRLTIVAIIQLLIARNYIELDFSVRIVDLIIGVLSAIVLYFIFWLGNELAPFFVPRAQEKIAIVYNRRQQLELPLISLILLVVGPSEEIFWRGFIQQKLSQLSNSRIAYWSTALLYALLHIWTGNVMLILAALVAGLFWGRLFLRRKSLLLVIVSHTLWDILVFVLFPLYS